MKMLDRLSRRTKDRIYAYMLLLPTLLVIIALRLYPLLNGLYLGFTNKVLTNPESGQFIGLKNFSEALKDKNVYSVLLFTFIYTISVVFAAYVLGLGMALLLNKKFKLRGVFRSLALLPWVIAPSAAGYGWLWLLNDRYGFLNRFLENIGLISHPIFFLADLKIVRYTTIAFGTWKNFPFMAIMILAGLQSIPTDLYEAAKIDGSSAFNTFRRITFPLLRDITFISTTMMVIWTYSDYENIFFLTGGGPVTYTNRAARQSGRRWSRRHPAG
jgi:multiple sugar transport system permease protein